MRTEFKPHEPPNDSEIEQMWRELEIEYTPLNHPAIERVIELLRLTHCNGGAEFACFHVKRHPTLEWFTSRNRILLDSMPIVNTIDFFSRFLTLPATKAALPMMEIGQRLQSDLNLEWVSPFVLDGQIAETLRYGGMLQNRNLTGAQCKEFGKEFCDALYGDRYEDVLICSTFTQWSPWFKPPLELWDCTWFCFDNSLSRCWLLAVTGQD
jgi:hypothetical protein